MKIYALLALLLIAVTLATMLIWPELFVCDRSKPAGPAIGGVLRIMGCTGGR